MFCTLLIFHKNIILNCNKPYFITITTRHPRICLSTHLRPMLGHQISKIHTNLIFVYFPFSLIKSDEITFLQVSIHKIFAISSYCLQWPITFIYYLLIILSIFSLSSPFFSFFIWSVATSVKYVLSNHQFSCNQLDCLHFINFQHSNSTGQQIWQSTYILTLKLLAKKT